MSVDSNNVKVAYNSTLNYDNYDTYGSYCFARLRIV